jgi:hypothetical protein
MALAGTHPMANLPMGTAAGPSKPRFAKVAVLRSATLVLHDSFMALRWTMSRT